MKIYLGQLLFDLSANQLVYNGERTQVEPKVMALIHCLYSKRNQVISRESLLATVWPNQFVSENALTRLVSQARKLLEYDKQQACEIETIPKVGYRLNLIEGDGEFLDKNTNGYTESIAQSKSHESNVGGLKSVNILNLKIPFDAAIFKVATFVLITILLVYQYYFGVSSFDYLDRDFKLISETQLPGVERNPVISRNGRWLAFSHRARGEAFDRLMIKDRQNNAQHILLKGDFRILDIAWHPQANKILISRWQRGVKRECDIATVSFNPITFTTQVEPLIQCSDRSYPKVAWHYTKNKIYYSDRKSVESPYMIYSYSVDSHQHTQLTMPPHSGNLLGDFDLSADPFAKKLWVKRYETSTSAKLLELSMESDAIVNEWRFPNSFESWAPFDERHFVVKSDNQLQLFNYTNEEYLPIYTIGEDSWDISYQPKINELLLVKGVLDTNIVSYLIDDNSAREDNLSDEDLSNSLEFGKTQSKTHILPRLALVKLKESLITDSTANESHGTFANQSQKIAYYSDASGSTQIWLRQESGQHQQLTKAPLSLDYGYLNWSPNDNKIAFLFNGEIYTTDTRSGDIRRLIDKSHQPFFASWSMDSRSLYYSSNKSGDWQIWQYTIATNEHRQITQKGGYSVRASDDHFLYYSKIHEPGLWRLALDANHQLDKSNANDMQLYQEQKVIDNFPVVSWRSWQLQGRDLFYIASVDEKNVIQRLDLNKLESTQLFILPEHHDSYFSVKDQRILLTSQFQAESDVYSLSLKN